MSRYSIKPKSFYVEDDVYRTVSVSDLHVPDHVATPTGILDVNGDMFYRNPRPMGFGREFDW